MRCTLFYQRSCKFVAVYLSFLNSTTGTGRRKVLALEETMNTHVLSHTTMEWKTCVQSMHLHRKR